MRVLIRPFNNMHPSIAVDAYISETAVIIGDVEIGAKSSIWFNVVIRGDVNSIRIGCRTNIQDLSILHVSGDKGEGRPGSPLIIGDNVTIGHNVTLHGCTVGDNAFIGMNALVMDRAVIGDGAMVAAGSLVPEGAVIASGTLWMGSPAKFSRSLSPEEKTKSSELAAAYVSLSQRYLD